MAKAEEWPIFPQTWKLHGLRFAPIGTLGDFFPSLWESYRNVIIAFLNHLLYK
jgi:hypothetical protein